MCGLGGLAVILGMGLAGCGDIPATGYDETTRTDSARIAIDHGRSAFRITCTQEMQLCIRRAEAICPGGYRAIDAPQKRPRVQAFVDGGIRTVHTDNPSVLVVACE
jgi:hypothetical protein